MVSGANRAMAVSSVARAEPRRLLEEDTGWVRK